MDRCSRWRGVAVFKAAAENAVWVAAIVAARACACAVDAFEHAAVYAVFEADLGLDAAVAGEFVPHYAFSKIKAGVYDGADYAAVLSDGGIVSVRIITIALAVD